MMNFKLSFKDPKFFVNEEKKVVTCVLNYWLNLPDYISCETLDNLSRFYGNNSLIPQYIMSVSAQAKLDPHDEFNVEVGMKVARAKAESKAYDQTARRLCNIFDNFIDKFGHSIETFCEKADGVVNHNARYINQF